MFTSISSVPSELRDAVGHPTFDPTGQSKEVGEKLGKLLGLDPAEAPAFTRKTTPHVLTIKSKGFPGIITGFFLGAKPQISRNEKFIGPKWKKTPVYLQPGDTQTMFGDRATGHPGHPPVPVTPSPCPLLPHALLAPKVCASGPTEKVAQL